MTSTPIQPQPLPLKPNRSQLKYQSKLLDSFLPSSNLINLRSFKTSIEQHPLNQPNQPNPSNPSNQPNQSNQSNQPNQPNHPNQSNQSNQSLWSSHLQSSQLDSLVHACSLDDLIKPLDPIFKDSNLLSELRDHQHELSTPYGSLHALHTVESTEDQIEIRKSNKRTRSSNDLISSHDLDPNLICTPSNHKPKRIRKKAAGKRLPIEFKPEPIKRLIGILESSKLNLLKQTYDSMYFVKAVGRSDWNTTTQPIFSTTSTSNNHSISKTNSNIILTITFHPIDKSDLKSISPRQQTIMICSFQTLSNLKDNMICGSDSIPKHYSNDDDHPHPQINHQSENRWDSGCICLIENQLFTDRRGIGLNGKSDYGLLLDRLTKEMGNEGPEIIIEEKEDESLKNKNDSSIYARSNSNSDIPINPLSSSSNDDIPVKSISKPKTINSSNSKPKLFLSSIGMEDVKLEDLDLKLGEPYWLLHQGNCEHIFTVDEIRSHHPTDPPISIPSHANSSLSNQSIANPTTTHETSYPITTFLSRSISPKCRICDRDPAKVVILNDELLDESPCFVCEKCFELLHGHHQTQDQDQNQDWWFVPLLGT